ncbi:MAG: sulfotransferase [Bacteroidota bacterium]
MLKKILTDTKQRLFRQKIRYSARKTAHLHKAAFASIEKYVVFLGYPRSGHSMVGSLMDAHPEMVIAHELNALQYVEEGYSQEELFGLILHNTEAYGKNDRKWENFTYAVKGQWQGRYANLRVIGDKKGGRTTFMLMDQADRLNRLKERVKLPMYIIHLTRNPFDNIARMYLKDQPTFEKFFPVETLADMADVYFRYSESIARATTSVSAGQLLEMKHEDFSQNPHQSVSKICQFLGLDAAQDYLDACADLIYDSPNKSRHQVQWPPELIASVQERIGQYDFLQGYHFGS